MTERPTRAQILSEPAGPQLDAWVARYVFGWVHVKDAINDRWQVDGVDFTGTEPWKSRRCPGDDLCPKHALAWEHGWPCTLPEFSRDIACAWEVVEAMCADPYADEEAFMMERHYAGVQEWWVNFLVGDQTFEEIKERRGCAETPSLAICRAALLALLPEEESK